MSLCLNLYCRMCADTVHCEIRTYSVLMLAIVTLKIKEGQEDSMN